MVLDNTEMELRYTMNALANLEDLTGMTISKFAELSQTDASAILGIKFIRAALYAGLKESAPKITLEGIGKMMKPGELGDYTLAISRAIVLAMGGDLKNLDDPLEEGGQLEVVRATHGPGSDFKETPTQQESSPASSGS